MASSPFISLTSQPAGAGTLLRLAEPLPLGPGRLLSLEVELPSLPGPVDRARQQRQRGRLRSAEFVLEQEALNAWLLTRQGPELRERGIDRVQVRLNSALAMLTAQMTLAGRRVLLTARVLLGHSPGEARMSLALDSVRVYRFTPTPAPLCGLRLAQAYLGAASASAEGVALHLDPWRLCLGQSLVMAGFRLPETGPGSLLDQRLLDGRLVLATGSAPAGGGSATSGKMPSWTPADQLLAEGRIAEAEAAYRALSEEEPAVAAMARGRLLSLLCTQPARFDEATALAREELERSRNVPTALLALAALAAEQGAAEEAARHYAALAELPDNSPEETACAALSGAELLGRSDPKEATLLLERAAAIPGGLASARAAALLIDRYTQEGRWESLAELLGRQLSMVPKGAKEERQKWHLRLGSLYLEKLNDPVRAGAEVEKALRLSDRNPAVWELQARLLEGRGRKGQADALRALDRAAEVAQPELAPELLLRAGALAERSGDLDAAVQRYRKVLEQLPGHEAALGRLAELLIRQDRLDEAREAYEAVLERAPGGEGGDALRRHALLRLSRLALEVEKDEPRARGYLGRALALGGQRDPEVLRAWAQMEEEAGHFDNVEKALARLEELGLQDGMLRRAEVQVTLGRPGEAVQVLERLLASSGPAEQKNPPELAVQGLRVLVRARQAMGDTRGMRDALERLLLKAPGDRRARIDLGRVLLLTGDLRAAREHLRQVQEEPAALEPLIEVLTRQGDEDALEEVWLGLARRLASDPERRNERALALARLAGLRARRGRKAEALACLREALALAPLADEALRAAGEAALALGQYHEARAAWGPLLERQQGAIAEERSLPAEAAGRIAMSLAELGEEDHPDEALHYYRLALTLGVSGPEAARARGGIIRLASHAETAAREDAKAQALAEAAEDPSTEEPPLVRANLFRQAADIRRAQGRGPEAVAFYEQALNLDPTLLPALDALEAMAEQSGDDAWLAEVLTRKAKGLARRPDERKEVLGRLGNLYAGKLERRDLAREVFRQALALDPAFRPGLLFLAQDAAERGDHGAELAHLKRLASLNEGEPGDRAQIHQRLSSLHRRAGRHEEAERQAQLVLSHDPANPQALAFLDERYTATDRHVELADILRRRADSETDPIKRRNALGRRARILDEVLGQPALFAYHELVRMAPEPKSCIRLAELALAAQALDEIQDVAPVLGRTLLHAGRARDAIRILEHATRRGGGEPLFALLAEAYEAVGDSEAAANAWSAAGRVADPMRHAQSLERAERLDEAMAAWALLGSIEPHLKEQARAAAAAIARRAMEQRPEEADRWARRLLEVAPGNVAALSRVLVAHPPEGLPEFLASIEEQRAAPEAAELWLQVAQALPEGSRELQRQLLQRSLELAATAEAFLLLAALCEGMERLVLLQQGLGRYPADSRLALALVEAARTAGARDLARSVLLRAGDSDAVLHARVALDRDALSSVQPGSEADLAPLLLCLRERRAATPEELLLLARLLTARGDHETAARVQAEGGGNPQDLLAVLESDGRYPDLLDALTAHAGVRPEAARDLYLHAAEIAEERLGAPAKAAALLEQAAFCQGTEEAAAVLWSRAGHLWNQIGERERGAAALGRALAAGGERTPGVLLALGDYSFEQNDWDAAARHYRRAFAVEQVPHGERGRIRLRLASIERRRGNAAAEEQELAAAVEAGAGAQAWPALAALFQTQGENARLGAALLAWADYEADEARLALLRQAAGLVTDTLLPRVDDELTRLDADDEEVRDRVLARLRQQGDQPVLCAALQRDVDKSRGERRAHAARELAAVHESLSEQMEAGAAWRTVMETSSSPQRDAQALLLWLSRVRQGGLELPMELLAGLRALFVEKGPLAEAVALIDWQLDALAEDQPLSTLLRSRAPTLRMELLWHAAELTEALGDVEKAAARWVHISAARPTDPVARAHAQRLLRTLAAGERQGEALSLLETELRNLGPAGMHAHALRVLHAELLSRLGRTEDAIGQLDLVLMREPRFGPAHALLGILLLDAPQSADVARGLQHLITAAHAPDVEPTDRGECALLAGELLLAVGAEEPGGTAEGAPGADPQALLDRAAELLPRDRRPLEGLLRLALVRGQHARAVELLDQQLALVPDPQERARLFSEKARVLRRLARSTEAEAALQEALRCDPELPDALHGLRQLLEDQGELDEAEALCLRELAVAADPSLRASLFLDLGRLRDQRGNDGGAVEAFRSAGELGRPAGYREVARRLAQQQRFSEAAEAAIRAAELAPGLTDERGEALLLVARLLEWAGDEARARGYLEQAQRLGGQVAGEALRRMREMDGGPDPQVRKQVLLDRLERAQGPARLDLLRRLLALSIELKEQPSVSRLAEEVLALAPADDLAFESLLDLYQSRGDTAALCALWQRRGAALADPLERAAALCTAAALSDSGLQSPEAAERLYVDAALVCPGHPDALLGLADLAYRRGDYERAHSLYQAPELGPVLGTLTLDRPDALEILRRVAELSEAAGDIVGAAGAYHRVLELTPERPAAGGSLSSAAREHAAEELTRLYQGQGDYQNARVALNQLLPFLPEGATKEAVQRRVKVRLHLGWLSVQVGDLAEARRHLQYLLSDAPTHRDGLILLLEVHRRAGEFQQAAEVLDRLGRQVQGPEERADLIFERAALYEAELGNPERAFELYQQALDVLPAHAPSLRRLIVSYLREANGVGIAEAVRELEEQQQPLNEVRCLAGVGLALAGNDEHADRLLAGATVEELALALCSIGLPRPGDLSLLDEPIAAAVRALGGTAELPRLESAIRQRLHAAPFGIDVGARQILARLAELRGEPSARTHLSVLAFLMPEGYASQRLEVMGPAPQQVLLDDPLPAAARGPLRDAMALLGRHVLGLPAPPLPTSPDWGMRLRPLGHATGLPRLDVAVMDEVPGGEPARCDPTRPPRLRLLRRLTADSAQARFAALRALRLLLGGVPLLQGRSFEDVRAFLRAAARLFLPEGRGLDPLAQSWLAELRALYLRPESLPPEQREQAQEALAACMDLLDRDPAQLEAAVPLYIEASQRAAERQALTETGDLQAALLAVCPTAMLDSRLEALKLSPLSELIAFADSYYRP